MTPSKRKIVLLRPKLAPGDSVVLTAIIRDIALTRPGEFEIDIVANFKELFDNNPYITPLAARKAQSGVEYVNLAYNKGLREQRYETIHFLSYFHRDFAARTGIKIPLTRPYPDLHLTADERDVRPIENRYWVILPGWKQDATVKLWHHTAWAELLDRLSAYGLRFVQLGSTNRMCTNPKFSQALDLTGQTTLRQMLQLIQHADGVICGVTCAMHMAAALHKPCVVLGGGREAWWWEAYVPENAGLGGLAIAKQQPVPHRYLHTIGLLDCCQFHGCWKNKLPGLPTREDKVLCTRPVQLPDHPAPECMTLITPAMVERAVLSYYLDGTLMPESGTLLDKEVSHVREGSPWPTPTVPTSQLAPI